MDYKLTKQDLNQIESLIKTTNSIERIYNKLYELEINDQKDSDEYKKTIEILEMAIEIENKKYKEFRLNSHKAIAWLDFLLQDILPIHFENNIENASKQNNQELTKRRIINALISKIINTKNEGLSDKLLYLIKELQYFKINLHGANPEDYDEFVNNKILEDEVLKLFFSHLQQQIEITDKKIEFKKFKNSLIKTKYNAIFINKSNENNMIENNFNIDKIPVIDPITLYGYSAWDEMIKREYAHQIYAFQTFELVNLSNADYNSDKNITTAIIRQAFIKTALSLLEEKEQDRMYDGFDRLTKSAKYLSFCPNSSISESLIKNSFTKHKILTRKE